MINASPIRQLIILLLLFAGPLTQFQTRYSCELMALGQGSEQSSTTCCCDEKNELGVMSCEMNGSCQNQAQLDSDCCSLSYETSSLSQASNGNTQAQQTLLLDAAQPPPFLISALFADTVPAKHTFDRAQSASVTPSVHAVYRLTQRFRI